MKLNKKGFTLIEIIVCVIILVIVAGIFSVNFIKNLRQTENEEYENVINRIESSADAYVTNFTASDAYSDIEYVIANEDTFCFISLDEIMDSGYLSDDLVNPKTGEKFTGVVKFTQEKGGNFKFKYVEDTGNYLTVIYDKNGANEVERTAQTFACESTSTKGDLAECVKNAVLPSVVRRGGEVYGWSTDRDAKDSSYKTLSSLSTLIKNENCTVNNNKITLYAISSETMTASLNSLNGETIEKNKVSCKVYNSVHSCKITLPNFTSPNHFYPIGWYTNNDASGDYYEMGKSMTLLSNTVLYAKSEVEDFDIYTNKLNRVSESTVTPSNINIIFVLDVSGSMSSNNRLSNLKTVSKGLVEHMNLDNSTVSLIKFNGGASTVINTSQDKDAIISAINSLTASGGTTFTAAIKSADNLVSNITNGKDNYVIFVSDGQSSIDSSYEYLVSLKEKANIYSMGIGSGAGNSDLLTIASASKNYYEYSDTSDDMTLSNFYSLFTDIVQNIVVLKGDGEENAIKVTVKKGKLELGNLVLSSNYPLDIYYNGELLNSYIDTNDYIVKTSDGYYFNVLAYARDNGNIGIDNMTKLRIKFFYKTDSKE